jgi:hypothetical protein
VPFHAITGAPWRHGFRDNSSRCFVATEPSAPTFAVTTPSMSYQATRKSRPSVATACREPSHVVPATTIDAPSMTRPSAPTRVA